MSSGHRKPLTQFVISPWSLSLQTHSDPSRIYRFMWGKSGGRWAVCVFHLISARRFQPCSPCPTLASYLYKRRSLDYSLKKAPVREKEREREEEGERECEVYVFHLISTGFTIRWDSAHMVLGQSVQHCSKRDSIGKFYMCVLYMQTFYSSECFWL